MPERTLKRTARIQATEVFRDYTLIFVVLFLLALGLVMLYSTSSYEAALQFGDSAHYLKKQLFSTVIGLLVMLLVSVLPYRLWGRLATPAFILAVVLILAIIPFGVESGGAKRWLYFFGVSFQPAEAAKLATIVVAAAMIEKLGSLVKTLKGMFLVFLPPAILSFMLYKITRNLSSAMIVMAIVACMVFVAVPDYKRFVVLAILVVAAGAFWIFLTLRNAQAAEDTLNFRGNRILAWLDPQAYADDTAFQTLQALYAIGSGGLFGKGLGQSMQKLGYIPEAQNDMIFSIICEELGLFGAICIILLFIIMIWRFIFIANNAVDLFGAMLVVGVTGHIAVQVILNIAVVTNTIPNTGVTLPFISYGGTSVLFLLFEVGMVLSVARGIRLKAIDNSQ
ncbi:MAG: cell division protein FtsW [Lachnospiraceae bacterium]|nr:cell division protein FtsW [Lachnospiraceae bacterium]